MYLSCYNSKIASCINEKAETDYSIIFGKYKYPVLSKALIQASPFFLSIIQKHPTEYSATPIPKDIANDIIKYLYGKTFLLTVQNITTIKYVSLEMGFTDLIESCHILEQADQKILILIPRLTGNSIPNKLCEICTRYFSLFTLYQNFLSIEPQVLLHILKNTQILGIFSELDFVNWLIKYYKEWCTKKADILTLQSIFSYAKIDYCSAEDKKSILSNKIATELMRNPTTKPHFRVLVEKPGSEGFMKEIIGLVNAQV